MLGGTGEVLSTQAHRRLRGPDPWPEPGERHPLVLPPAQVSGGACAREAGCSPAGEALGSLRLLNVPGTGQDHHCVLPSHGETPREAVFGQKVTRCAGHNDVGGLHLAHPRSPFSRTLLTDPRKAPLHQAFVRQSRPCHSARVPRGRCVGPCRHRPQGHTPQGPLFPPASARLCVGSGPSHLLFGSPERPLSPPPSPASFRVGAGEASCVWLFSWVQCPYFSLIVKYIFTFQPSNLTNDLYKNRELKSFREIVGVPDCP